MQPAAPVDGNLTVQFTHQGNKKSEDRTINLTINKFVMRDSVLGTSLGDQERAANQRGLPYLTFALQQDCGGDDAALQFVNPVAYAEADKIRRAPPSNYKQLLIFRTFDANQAVPLYRYENDKHTAVFIKALYPVTEENRNEVADAQYLAALQFIAGVTQEALQDYAEVFARQSAENGHILGRALLQTLSKKVERFERPVTSPALKYPTGTKVKFLFMAFRELIAELSQPAIVTDVKFERGDICLRDFHNDWRTLREVTIILTVRCPDGSCKFTLKDNAWYSSSDDSLGLGLPLLARYEDFVTKNWGLHLVACFLPTHPLYAQFSRFTDYLTTTPDGFTTMYEYNNVLTGIPILDTYKSVKKRFFISDKKLTAVDLISSPETQVILKVNDVRGRVSALTV